MDQAIILLVRAKSWCMRIGALFFLLGIVWFIAGRVYRSLDILSGLKRSREWKKIKKGLMLVFLTGIIGGCGALILAPVSLLAADEDESGGEEDPSPFIVQAFEVEALEGGIYTDDTLYADGPVRASLIFSDNNPDPESIRIRMIPLDSTALHSVRASENEDESGAILLPAFYYNQIDENKYEVGVNLSQEGRWKCTFYCEDLAGNALTGVRDGDSREFVIDTRSPQLEVTYNKSVRITEKPLTPGRVNEKFRMDMTDIESSEGEVFFEADSSLAIITIREENFIPDNASITIKKAGREKEGDLETCEEAVAEEDYFLVEEWVRISENEYRTKIDFSKQGHYKIKISCPDAAGHCLTAGRDAGTAACMDQGDYHSPLLTLDRTDPELICRISDRKNEDAPVIHLEILEENFHPELIRLTDLMTDADKESMGQLSLQDYRLEWKSLAGKKGLCYSADLTVEEEANHKMEVRVSDPSGNKSKDRKLSFTYDKTPPVISYTGMDNESGDILFVYRREGQEDEKVFYHPYGSYAYFHQGKITVCVTAEDRVSGVGKITCRFRGRGWKRETSEIEMEDRDSDEEIQILPSPDGEVRTKLTGYAAVSRENFKGTVKISAVDLCRNTGEEISCLGMISESEDLHKKTGGIDFELPDPDRKDSARGIGYYKKAPIFKASFHDSYSGINYCSLSALMGKKCILTGEKELSDRESDLLYQCKLSLKPEAGSLEDSSSENPIRLRAYLKDNAGNESQWEYEDYGIVVDSIPPEIDVKYDSYDAVNHKYYARERTAFVTVRDRNFDPESTLWEIRGPEKSYSISSWEREGDTAKCHVTFHRDGKDFKLKVRVSDLAGNQSLWDEDREFTIDRTPPLINLSMDKRDVRNGHFYKKDKKIQMIIRDDNPDPEKVTWKIRGQCDDKSIKIDIPKADLEKNNTLLYELDFREDGDYSLSLECEDRAGNRSRFAGESFTIDKKKPKVEIAGISEGATYCGSLNPSVKVWDRNADSRGISISLVRIGTGDVSEGKSYHGSYLSHENGMETCWGDFDHRPDVDGVYRLRVKGEDLAGNKVAEGEGCLFYVNRFGSVYSLDQSASKMIKTFYVREEKDLCLREYSVNPVRSKLILIRDNEERIELSQPEDYQRVDYDLTGRLRAWEDSSPSGYRGWKRYDYYINKENFSRQGVYQLRIQSDAYEYGEPDGPCINRTDNEKKKRPVTFAIDKTPPEVILSESSGTGYHRKRPDYLFTLVDNLKLDYMDITLESGFLFRDKEVIRVREKNLDDRNCYLLKAGDREGSMKISYEAVDRAGNRIRSAEKGDSRIWLAPVGNQGGKKAYPARLTDEGEFSVPAFLWLGMGVIFLTIPAGGLFFFIRHRIKKGSES